MDFFDYLFESDSDLDSYGEEDESQISSGSSSND